MLQCYSNFLRVFSWFCWACLEKIGIWESHSWEMLHLEGYFIDFREIVSFRCDISVLVLLKSWKCVKNSHFYADFDHIPGKFWFFPPEVRHQLFCTHVSIHDYFEVINIINVRFVSQIFVCRTYRSCVEEVDVKSKTKLTLILNWNINFAKSRWQTAMNWNPMKPKISQTVIYIHVITSPYHVLHIRHQEETNHVKSANVACDMNFRIQNGQTKVATM